MGIAACQARFLTITARKANCESDAMQIAQQKLSVTRDQMKASNEYQSALNATKLAWATDGAGLYYNQAGLGGDVYDLSYNLMMTPSVLNDYTPYMLTNRSGQIVLNPTMAAAAKAAGLKPNGGSDLSIENRNAFIEALGDTYLAPSLIDSIESAGADGYNYNVGLGGPQLDKTSTTAMNINYLMTYSDSLYASNSTQYSALKFHFNTVGFKTGNDSGKHLSINGKQQTTTGTATTDFALADLFDHDIVYSVAGGSSTARDNDTVIAFIDNLSAAFKKILAQDPTTQDALDRAGAMTKMLLTQGGGGRGVNNLSDAVSSGINEADKANGWYVTLDNQEDGFWSKVWKGISFQWGSIDSSTGDRAFSISLSNLARSFLTYFAQDMGGYQTGYSVNNNSQDSVYVTDDLSYMFPVNNPNSVCDQKDFMTADFYNMLFNNIAVHGWTESTDVDDKNYLSNALKNGQLFVSALNTDGYFYQADYTKNGRVIEVKDDDAISRAELKYNQEKNKLDYKDQTLDVKMKNIDLELSALTTEYDSVKNLISKNVEKTFALFQ